MRTLVKMVHGSHLYGLNTENSDTDYKSVYLPDTDEVLLETYKKEFNESTGDSSTKNTKDDVDSVIFSLPKFLKMACDGDTVALDMLHCSDTETTSPEWEFIRENRHRFYTRNMKAFIGYAKKQAAKYGIKGSRLSAIEDTADYLCSLKDTNSRLDDPLVLQELECLEEKHPEHITIRNGFEKNGKFVDKHIFELCGSKYDLTSSTGYVYSQVQGKYEKYGSRAKMAKENKGVDWKALSHALRAAYQLEEIYLTGDLKYPLRDRQFLLEVKKGKHDYTSVVAPELERVIHHLEILSANSSYPEKVDSIFWDDFLLSVYKGEFRTKAISVQDRPKVKYGLYDTKNKVSLRFTEESNANRDFCGDSTFRVQFSHGKVLKLDSVEDVLNAVVPANGSPEWYNAWSIERPVVDDDMFATDGKLDPRFVVVKYTETVEPIAN